MMDLRRSLGAGAAGSAAAQRVKADSRRESQWSFDGDALSSLLGVDREDKRYAALERIDKREDNYHDDLYSRRKRLSMEREQTALLEHIRDSNHTKGGAERAASVKRKSINRKSVESDQPLVATKGMGPRRGSFGMYIFIYFYFSTV